MVDIKQVKRDKQIHLSVSDRHLDPPEDQYFDPPEMQGHQEEFLKDLENMTVDNDFNQASSDDFYEAVEMEIDRLKKVLEQ